MPIRDCAKGCSNRAQMCPQLSAVHVTVKTFFKRLYLVLGLRPQSIFLARKVDCSVWPKTGRRVGAHERDSAVLFEQPIAPSTRHCMVWL